MLYAFGRITKLSLKKMVHYQNLQQGSETNLKSVALPLKYKLELTAVRLKRAVFT